MYVINDRLNLDATKNSKCISHPIGLHKLSNVDCVVISCPVDGPSNTNLSFNDIICAVYTILNTTHKVSIIFFFK